MKTFIRLGYILAFLFYCLSGLWPRQLLRWRGSWCSNTTGTYNTFVGIAAGNANTTGYYNSFLGSFAGWKKRKRHLQYLHRHFGRAK